MKYISKDGPLDKEKDLKSHQQLEEDFLWMKLKQSLHLRHTHMNKSFNNMLSYIAPKNVNFLHSNSLSYRFALCIALYNEGFYEIWSSIYEKMDRKSRSNFARYLIKEDKRKVSKRLISSRETHVKYHDHQENP